MAMVDYTPCGCPACKRSRGQKVEPARRGVLVDALVIGATLLAGVAVALVVKRWLG